MPEPIVTGYLPWKVAVSETVVVGWTETGARGGGGGPEAAVEGDTTRWRDVVAGGGFKEAEDEDNEAIAFTLFSPSCWQEVNRRRSNVNNSGESRCADRVLAPLLLPVSNRMEFSVV